MKILLISHFFPPDHWSGIEIYTYNIAKHLQNQGYQVQVLCAEGWTTGVCHWNGYTDDMYNGIPIRRLRLNWTLAPDPFGYLYRNPVVQAFLGDYLETIQPDIVHITSTYSLSASVIEAIKEKGIPIAITLADFWFVCPRINLTHANGNPCDGIVSPWACSQCKLWDAKIYRLTSKIMPEPLQRSLFTWAGRHPILARQPGMHGMVGDIADRRTYLIKQLNEVDLIILPSTFLKEQFVKHGVEPKQMKVITWGVAREWANTLFQHKRERPKTVGYIGRITPIKGVHVLIQAFMKLNGPFDLQIFGRLEEDPNYTIELEKLAKEDPRVHFLGGYNYNLLGEVLSGIDVLVVPSIWPETFCLTAREGIIANIPILGTAIGAIPEAISHNENGFLFAPNNVDDLADYLHRVMKDPNLWQQLRTARKSVKTVAEETQELVELYATIRTKGQSD